MKPIIALLSDFGTGDYFVGAMKGAILSINPAATIVDLTHDIPKRNILAASFTLAHAAESFPPGTIFIAVVDPGVGTKRKCVLLSTKNGFHFIAPDNGLLTLAAERFGVNEIRELSNKEFMGREISATFHGRDVMAPVAAHLSLGLEPSEVGPRLKTIQRLEIPGSKLTESEIRGAVLHVDDFGNLITNIGAAEISGLAKLGDTLKVEVGGKKFLVKFARTFGDVKAGERLCYIGSAGMLELAKSMGNLAEELRLKPGASIVIRR